MLAEADNKNKLIHKTYNISLNEKIYDDFGCAYIDAILFKGRMFLTESFLCFNSNILGMSKIIKLSLCDIYKVEKKQFLLVKNIQISSSEKLQINDDSKKGLYYFTPFSNRNITYSRLISLIKVSKLSNNRKYNNNFKKDSSDSELSSIDHSNNTNSVNLNQTNLNDNYNLLKFEKIPSLFIQYESSKIILPIFIISNITIECFFDNYIGNKAIYGIDSFGITQERKEFVIEDWENIEDGENL